MKYKSILDRDEKGNYADRKQRKSMRKSVFEHNKSLHTASAKKERRAARAAAAAKAAEQKPAA